MLHINRARIGLTVETAQSASPISEKDATCKAKTTKTRMEGMLKHRE